MLFETKKTRVALFGGGFIAPIHVQALRRCRWIDIVGIHDTNERRAERFARAHGLRAITEPTADWLAKGEADAVHLIIPPDVHVAAARPCIEAGMHVLIEKPIALTSAEALELEALAAAHDVTVGVNHNMVFHPAVVRLARDLDRGKLGRLEHVAVVHNVPLRQLGTGDVGHFMFRTQQNILLEQAVHPFSVLYDLLGPCHDVRASVDRRTLINGQPFIDRWMLSMHCERGTAQVLLAFGRDMLEQTFHAIGTDGSVRLDLARNTYVRTGKTRWLDAFDAGSNAVRGGAGLARQGVASAANYVLTLGKLRRTTDPYLVSMEQSIIAYHQALRGFRGAPCSASSGAEVLRYCERTAAAAGLDETEATAQTVAETAPTKTTGPRDGEIVITGGGGFVGRQLVAQLLDAGRPVTVMVRNAAKLPRSFDDPRIRVVVGDAGDAAALDRAFQGASKVVHLATCMSEDPASIEKDMADAAREVGIAASRNKVDRVIFTSTSAALYLGAGGSINGAEGPDPMPAKRAPYARGKIASEIALGEVAASRGLDVVILRPAIVVGEGGMADHSGVGLWLRDNHCVGWGMGNNPLPLVLARDVASAIVGALDSPEAVGKAYNLAGDVRLSARQYIAALKRTTGRDYHYHPTPTAVTQAIEVGKWVIKKAVRRPGVEFPSYRDFLSRGFFTSMDCADAKRDLDWQPERDRERFIEEAIAVHGPRDEGSGA